MLPVFGSYYSREIVSLWLYERELEVQVWFPASILLKCTKPGDYLAGLHLLSDSLTFYRGGIEMAVQGPYRNTIEQVLGDYHITIITVSGIVAEV